MADQKLTIDLSEEYKIKIEDSDKLKGSFFEEIYLKAAKSVVDIIEQTKKSDPTKNKEIDPNDPFLNETQDYNNIIAFCGERGTGKSSAMITFAKSLTKLDETGDFYSKQKDLDGKIFKTIKVVDPSLFEKHENIFEVILAQLFSSFEKELNKKEKESDLNVKRELLEQFEKVYENLQTIRKDGQKYDGEALETLNKLACGANLRQNFKELVKLYLNFIVDKENRENAYLIIPIDDFDLNVNAAAEMAEQIRKYLMIPRVIVLMAVKIEQLADAKEQQVRKNFKVLIKANRLNDSPEEITSKYILKLVPINRRIEMPFLSTSIDACSLEIRKNKSSLIEYSSIFRGFEEECYEKGSLLISLREFKEIKIFPKTLRELIEFFTILNKSKNSNDFTRFLISIFKLKQTQSAIIQQLWLIPSNQKNHFLIHSIVKDLINYREIDKMSLIDELESSPLGIKYDIQILLDPESRPHNITLGDLLLFLKVISETKYYSIYADIIILIKLVYSIWLTDARKSKKFQDIVELTNGGIYNRHYREIIRRGKNYSRCQFEISDFKKLQIDSYPLEGILKNDLTGEQVRKIELLSYFIEYPVNSKYNKGKASPFYYKDYIKPFYERKMLISRGSIIENPIFNVLQIVTNSLIPSLSFDRAFNSYYFGEGKEGKNQKRDNEKLNSFCKEMENWQSKYGLIIPFNSIFMFEYLISSIDTDIKERTANLSIYITFLFKEIERVLSEFSNDSTFLSKQNFVASFIECPIVKLFLNEIEQDSLVKVIDNIQIKPDEKEPTISSKNKKTQIEEVDEIEETTKDENEILIVPDQSEEK